ncbi:MAG: pyridoxamine 5'-phosphate oxidase family protein [Acidobacteria bacterium]|nr:pyridoxamine 5'-phosphate oxidase family protein [Acidobacteriota bacterium]
MSDELRQRVLTYLQSHNVMTLATTGPDGPWVAGLFYVNDGFDLYWLSDPDTRHSRNIVHNPHVAVAIHEDYRDWRIIQGIQMEGAAEQIGMLAQAVRPMKLYLAKYPFLGDLSHLPLDLTRALAATRVYKFTPTRVYFIDNTKGLGHREELETIWLEAKV